jgi:hypothetical protein
MIISACGRHATLQLRDWAVGGAGWGRGVRSVIGGVRSRVQVHALVPGDSTSVQRLSRRMRTVRPCPDRGTRVSDWAVLSVRFNPGSSCARRVPAMWCPRRAACRAAARATANALGRCALGPGWAARQLGLTRVSYIQLQTDIQFSLALAGCRFSYIDRYEYIGVFTVRTRYC